MAGIERSTLNYEILIRFNPGGKIGAHLQTLSGYTEDGVFVQAPQLDEPVQLDMEELKNYVTNLQEADWYCPPALEQEE